MVKYGTLYLDVFVLNGKVELWDCHRSSRSPRNRSELMKRADLKQLPRGLFSKNAHHTPVTGSMAIGRIATVRSPSIRQGSGLTHRSGAVESLSCTIKMQRPLDSFAAHGSAARLKN
jgi:hypothetical protein